MWYEPMNMPLTLMKTYLNRCNITSTWKTSPSVEYAMIQVIVICANYSVVLSAHSNNQETTNVHEYLSIHYAFYEFTWYFRRFWSTAKALHIILITFYAKFLSKIKYDWHIREEVFYGPKKKKDAISFHFGPFKTFPRV